MIQIQRRLLKPRWATLKKVLHSSWRAKRRNLSLLALMLVFTSCFSNRIDTLLSEAEDAIRQNKFEEARKILQRVIDSDPESADANRARYKMGFLLETYFREQTAALEYYEEYLKKNDDRLARFEVLKKVAGLAFQGNRNLPRAIAAYDELAKMKPASEERDNFWLREGQAQVQLQKYQAARDVYNTILDQGFSEKQKEKAKFGIANSYYLEGKYEAAIEAFNAYLRRYKSEEYRQQAKFLQAQSYDYLDKPQEALQILMQLQESYEPKALIENRIAAVRKRIKPDNAAGTKKN